MSAASCLSMLGCFHLLSNLDYLLWVVMAAFLAKLIIIQSQVLYHTAANYHPFINFMVLYYDKEGQRLYFLKDLMLSKQKDT